jgi:hypothetical protein
MNNQNMNNFMSGMMNNQAFFNGGDQQDNPLFDDKKFQDSLNTGPRGGTSIQSLKTGGGNNPQFQYNPNEFSQPPQQAQQQPPFQQPPQHQSQPFQQSQPQFQQQQPPFQQPQPQFQQQQPPQFQQQQQPPLHPPMRQQPQQFHNQQQYQQQQYQQQLTHKFNDNVSQMSKNSQYSDCSKNSRNSNKSNKDSSPIKKLGNIINNKLKDKNDSIINSMSSHDTMTIKSSVYDTEDNNEIIKKIDNNSSNETHFEIVKDAILIVVIYLILSQDFLKRAISVYLPQIESESVVGSAMYGVIHAIIFIVFKIIFNSIFM